MKNIAVFFGGVSVEHEISILTGVMTVNSLNKELYNGIPVFVSEKGEWYTGKALKDVDNYKKIDFRKLTKVTLLAGDNNLYAIKKNKLKKLADIAVIINCMHGERGEDGSISAVAGLSNIALASPQIAPSSICMSKTYTKLILKGLNINFLPYVTISSVSECAQVESKLDYPIIVKPDCGGSSIGIKRADNKAELINAVSFALRYGERVICEPYVEHVTEINCACYFAEGEIAVSECEQPVSRGEILSYNDKYQQGERVFPAKLDVKLAKKIKDITKKIYKNLWFSGVIRIDYMILNDKIYVNEINSVPGSLAYYLFTDTLSGFSALLTKLVNHAEKEIALKSTVITKYESGILSFNGCKSAKRLK